VIRWLTYRMLYRFFKRENGRLREELAESDAARAALRQRVDLLIKRNAALSRRLVSHEPRA
jgi:hypothetical protein